MVTFQLKVWRKTSGAHMNIIAGTSGQELLNLTEKYILIIN
jgi:hypothetical protein